MFSMHSLVFEKYLVDLIVELVNQYSHKISTMSSECLGPCKCLRIVRIPIGNRSKSAVDKNSSSDAINILHILSILWREGAMIDLYVAFRSTNYSNLIKELISYSISISVNRSSVGQTIRRWID